MIDLGVCDKVWLGREVWGQVGSGKSGVRKDWVSWPEPRAEPHSPLAPSLVPHLTNL